MRLFFAALPLRIRLDFETSRGFCGLAQNDAHCVPAAQMARPGCAHAQHPPVLQSGERSGSKPNHPNKKSHNPSRSYDHIKFKLDFLRSVAGAVPQFLSCGNIA
ncbi:hypothetical protein [Lapidilactobacillus salsurivasis]